VIAIFGWVAEQERVTIEEMLPHAGRHRHQRDAVLATAHLERFWPV
jgi:hypothetical protein